MHFQNESAAQTWREQVAESRCRHCVEKQQEEGRIATKPPRRTVKSADAENRVRSRPRADPAEHVPAAYISQQELSLLRNPRWESCCKQGPVQLQLLSDPPEYLKGLFVRADTQDAILPQLRSVMPTVDSLCEGHSRTKMPRPVTFKSLSAPPGSYIPMLKEILKRLTAENQEYQETQSQDQQGKPNYIARLFSLSPIPSFKWRFVT
ncbi:uncharacterized protein RHIMIDRAFT_242655 [Rhizopus microsporus ATCC 52813]|uniref:Uncharacterized protein n=1 Tax=Rhizopus microsporus ATCC 52813 TaxID=1340429 RepID=A0A2G4SFA6_RHIZD|nr:uncharacterized protein RHIMIDRAFT_242655 [Rhizopus microsporus ATCC 52813]PHZ07447.1 hypothetical protein RHIMIDRAFT_242655 [Rhizopus microsporus ATCC 52813]